MLIQDRYASAIRSSNLAVDERTTYSDSDVLGAFGLASRERPLAVALERLFSGDNGAARRIVAILAQMLVGKAPHMRIAITHEQAHVMAQACLAWHRSNACRPCGGHGKLVIPGTLTLGHQDCKVCRGTGKRPFEREFHAEMRELAKWLIAEMERHQARAGGAAMAKLAPKLEI